MNNIVSFILEETREAVNNRIDEKFSDGYDTAAHICMDAITKRIDDLHKQINDGKFLTNQEQFLLAHLNELRKEVDSRLRNFDCV